VHGGIGNDCQVNLRFVDSEKIEKDGLNHQLENVDGILVPGGFGNRGIEGMIQVIRYAGKTRCLFSASVWGCRWPLWNSPVTSVGWKRRTARNSTKHPSSGDRPAPGAESRSGNGASMRLGSYPCRLSDASLACEAYGEVEIGERHRHRYEFNRDYQERLEACGLRITGRSPDGRLVEIVEIKDHPWFLGCQFHPEFKSRPTEPHPLFQRFIEAALRYRKKRAEDK
jgi:CTP synthase